MVDRSNDETMADVPGEEGPFPHTEGPGTVIGPYRLVSELGQGGFGVVYLAEQDEPVRRQVALKIIKLGMDTRQVIARFEAERQVLALMEHPGIARVLDAGATAAGRPYFVMELVKGDPITEYCDEHAVPLRERLALFAGVCGAVHHAHQKGVIHRDLKPSNILVTRVDGKPVPKVIDFGIAKATDPRLVRGGAQTQAGYLVGTPAYMSPEQSDPETLDIDTRSDIYSLGVVLYELLAGVTPFDTSATQTAGVAEMLRKVRETEPSRPSTRAKTLGDELQAIARHRSIDPAKLSSELQGDLDWIVLKALERDRARRYESASGFRADILHYLADEPVEARPPSKAYRLRKLIRRNRPAFAAAAIVLAALVLGVAGTTYGLFRAVAAEGLARAERDEARRQAEIAGAVNDFLNHDLLAAVAPSARAGEGRDVKMRDVLDRASERIEEAGRPGGRFADKPSVEAAVRETLGLTYRGLGEFETAQVHLRRALELRELPGTDPELLAGTLHNLAFLSVQQGDYAGAEQLYRRAIQVLTDSAGDSDAALASMAGLAVALREQGRMDEAEATLLDVLERQKRVLGEDHEETVVSMSHLANLYQSVGRYPESEALNRAILEIRTKVLPEDDPSTLSTLNNLANVVASAGRLGEAGELMQRVLEMKRRILGPEHPSTLNTMNNIGEVHALLGQWSEAERWHRETLALRDRVLGERHPRTILSASVLSFAIAMQGRFEEARVYSARAVRDARTELGPDHRLTRETEHRLAICLLGLGRPAESAALHRPVVEALAAADQVEMLAQARTYLGIAEARLGHPDTAAGLFREALPALPLWNGETPGLLEQVTAIVEDRSSRTPFPETAELLRQCRELLDRSRQEVAAAQA